MSCVRPSMLPPTPSPRPRDGKRLRIERRISRGLVCAIVVVLAGCTAPLGLAERFITSTSPKATASALPRETSPAPASDKSKGFEIAHVRPGRVVAIRSKPGGRIIARLDAVTEFGSQQTFGVVARRGRWVGLTTSALPNGHVGWLPAKRSLKVTRTSVTLMLDLSERRLVLLRGGRVRRRMTVGVGRPSSPTPKGRFAVTDKLSGSRYGSFYYGCCIIALSAHQPNLPAGWRGGDRIAIHGTTDPSSIGAAASAGCLRASESDLRVLARAVPLGAQVIISG
jgi:hypothetical protein